MRNPAQKRILVTGGAGFLGSYLCERLLDRGHFVVCLDSYLTGTRDNVAHLEGNPRFELIEHDIVEPISVEVDQIYHLACPASPVHYPHDPVHPVNPTVVGSLTPPEPARPLSP